MFLSEGDARGKEVSWWSDNELSDLPI